MQRTKARQTTVMQALGACLLLAFCYAPTAALGADSSRPPQRVASMNLCSDQWLLALLPKKRIVSLSFLATDPNASLYSQKAADIPINHGELEEVLSLQPDLVIGQAFTNQRALERLPDFGVNTLSLQPISTLDAVREEALRLGRELGVSDKAQQLVAEFDHKRQKLTNIQHSEPMPSALLLHARGYSVGADSIRSTLLQLAGFRNHAKTLTLSDYGRVSLEQIAHQPPDVMIFSPYAPGTASYAQRFLQHPAVQGSRFKRQQYIVPNALWMCATLSLIDAAKRLAEHRKHYQQQIDAGTQAYAQTPR